MSATPLAGRPHRPRKIQLAGDLYCVHSLRASAGDAQCDHDFEPAPAVKHADFAAWNCTRCGRVFRYEIWKSDSAVAGTLPRSQPEKTGAVAFLADGGRLLCDPAAF